MAYSTAFQATGTLGRISPKLTVANSNPLGMCCTAAISVIDCFIKYNRYSNEVKRTELFGQQLESEKEEMRASNREYAERTQIFKERSEIELEAIRAANQGYAARTDIKVDEINQKAVASLEKLKRQLKHQLSLMEHDKENSRQKLINIDQKDKQCLAILSKIKEILNDIHSFESASSQWQPDLEESYRVFLKKFTQTANALA